MRVGATKPATAPTTRLLRSPLKGVITEGDSQNHKQACPSLRLLEDNTRGLKNQNCCQTSFLPVIQVTSLNYQGICLPRSVPGTVPGGEVRIFYHDLRETASRFRASVSASVNWGSDHATVRRTVAVLFFRQLDTSDH